ncbi:MAG: nucleotidyltransferase family protein [Firmicutes bacterium]|nr:nucleotidyltransferase family protein [[Eubacterium] siraeum]MCM1487097.1 nucleotidyltransferase family protein [Bacillota bacterium]
MKICGIICEYNPFHNGHKYHIEQTKEKYGATHIAAVMSGNFTQRGDVALIDKYKRAETALKNGVDLVIELPVAYALSSAEQFAQGAVYLLNSLGCVNMLSFGSESGNIKLLREAAGAVYYAMESEEFNKHLTNGMAYPAALQKTIEKYYTDDVIETLTTPNNTLAIEYLKALDTYASPIEPVTIKRAIAEHDSEIDSPSEIASASQLRKMITDGKDISDLAPESDFSNTASILNIETAILSKLRFMNKSEIEKTPNAVLGLENRIYRAIQVSSNLNELYFLIKTKRYTLARIRRIVLSAFLGITKNDLKIKPSYVRILGMNSKGKEILSAANCELPINTSLAQLEKTSEDAKKQAKLEVRCDSQYALALRKKDKCGLDYTSMPVILD